MGVLLGIEHIVGDQVEVLKQALPVRVPSPSLGGDIIIILAAASETTQDVLRETADLMDIENGLARQGQKALGDTLGT